MNLTRGRQSADAADLDVDNAAARQGQRGPCKHVLAAQAVAENNA